MAKNENNVRIYGGEDSAVFVAPKGTAGPADLSEPTGFVELGWLSEDGISVDTDVDATTHRAFQGGTIVRRKKNTVERSISFQCLEETAAVLGLFYAGQTPEVTGTGETAVARVDLKNQTNSDERAFVIDVYDDGNHQRWVIPTASVEPGSLAFSNSDMTVYEFTLTVQGNDAYILTNSAGVTAESV